MGTAPGDKQSPAMPDPIRLVSKSIRHMQREGLDLPAATMGVRIAAEAAIITLGLVGIDEVSWLRALADEAERRYRLLDPSDTDTEVTDHGDGNGGQ